MADVSARGKLAFWGLMLTVLILGAVPSLVVVEKAREYWNFLHGAGTGTLKQLRVEHLPPPPGSDDALPDIHFVEFRMEAPDAERVELGGSFNRWKSEDLPMTRERGGPWEVVVALRPGVYYYSFKVNGEWNADPECELTAEREGRQVSVREVP